MNIHFNQEVFFTFILPPIIFAGINYFNKAAYTLQRKLFFKYLHYILLFSVLGTIFNFLIISFLTYIFNYFQAFSYFFEEGIIELSITEIFLFSAAISATNTESVGTFVKDEIEPKLSSILFGEGIVNDAICIVLYRIIKRFTDSNQGSD